MLVVVITARKGSVRLPNKNMLPLGNKPLSVWTLESAVEAGAPIILTTDIPELKEIGRQMGALIVDRPDELATSNCSHIETIRHALETYGLENSPVMLLQPTSPFRLFNIIKKCVRAHNENPTKTILTTTSAHRAVVTDGGKLVNHGVKEELWDGNVVIFPQGKLGDYTSVHSVRNYHPNTLQIDDESDYEQACHVAQTTLGAPANIFPPEVELHIQTAIKQFGISVTGKASLVVRPSDDIIDQNHPVIGVNHCLGLDNSRIDAVFVIANKELRNRGVSESMRHGLKTARVVFVRSNGEIDWLMREVPEIQNKCCIIDHILSDADNHMTTGVMAAHMLAKYINNITLIGFSSPANRVKDLLPFHHPAVSREIALLSQV